MKRSLNLFLLASLLISCTPQATAVEVTATQPAPTETSLPPIATSTTSPTETSIPTDTPSATPPACATPLNPSENATVPARGPFDFTWTSFAGAASYAISIGPTGWYPTNFPVSGTTLTRYMENFPSSSSYQWSITALNSAGQEICKAGPYAFVMSVDVAATASFVDQGVAGAPTANSPSTNSSGNQQNGSNNESNDEPSDNSSLDVSMLIMLDVDDSQCRLSVSFKVKSNHPFTFIRLLYRYSGQAQDEFVDLIPSSLEPYPAYNYYNATTPPLPVHYGDVVSFGVWYKVDIGTESSGVTLAHTMTNCNQ